MPPLLCGQSAALLRFAAVGGTLVTFATTLAWLHPLVFGRIGVTAAAGIRGLSNPGAAVHRGLAVRFSAGFASDARFRCAQRIIGEAGLRVARRGFFTTDRPPRRLS